MRKLKSLAAIALAAAMMVACLTACGPSVEVQDGGGDSGSTDNTGEPADSGDEGEAEAPGGEGESGGDSEAAAGELSYASGTVIRLACGYNNPNTGISFDAETAGEGVTLADGVTYNTGDLKPTWAELEKVLDVKFEDKFTGAGSSSKEFNYWKEQLDQVDMVSGTATLLNDNGVAGSIVNIAEYLDQMPNFKAYLDENPIVRLSITGDTSTGAIYFSPYFDGVADIERMPLMRTDWVQKLLNGEGEFTADASNNTASPVYEPYMPTSGTIDVEVVKKDGSGVETITKDYDTAGNIVDKMNAAGSISGVDAVNMLRTYIDEAYGGYYGTDRADLFIGQNAAWDADELVALLRCVVANPQTLNGTDAVQGVFTREDANNQRRVDMFRFAGMLFGVRGLESRQDYLYVGADNKLHDARQEPETYEALERMNDLVSEGLISEAFVQKQDVKTKDYLEQDLGFMHYDYNQTQTIYNEQEGIFDEGEQYMAAMVPVARWYDGTNEDGVYMRFTESWRSVKTDGWGISVAGINGDQDKLNACLKLIDYAYSEEGQILMSYGPEAFRNDDVTFMFNGKEMPTISDACREELWDKASGNYTNYARFYLGSTLSFLKSQAFEYQCTTEVGRLGAGYISNAIALGTIHHPELAVADDSWYTSVPTVLPTTPVDTTDLASLTELTTQFSSSSGDDQINILCDIIAGGYAGAGIAEITDAQSAADYVANTWQGTKYLDIKETEWEEDLAYYAKL